MGLQGFCRFGLLRHLGTGLPSRHPRPLRRQRQKGGLPAGGRGGREHRVARARLLPAPRRTGPQGRAQGEAARRSRRPDAATGNSRWACSTTHTSIRTRPNAWSAAKLTANWRSRRPAKRSRCSKTRTTSLHSTLETQDHRRDRAQRRPRAAGRLQRNAQHNVTVLEGIKAKVGDR